MKRMPSPSAVSIRLVKASRDIMVPVGLAGLPTSTPFSGVLRWAASNASPVKAWRGLARGLDQDRLTAERGENMPIGGIAGNGHSDAIAGLEHGEEGQDKGARGPG